MRANEHTYCRAIHASKVLNKTGYVKLEALRKRGLDYEQLLRRTDAAKAGVIYAEPLRQSGTLDHLFGDELKLGQSAP
jgi:hypothetical protein